MGKPVLCTGCGRELECNTARTVKGGIVIQCERCPKTVWHLTTNDRRLLKALRIGTETPEPVKAANNPNEGRD